MEIYVKKSFNFVCFHIFSVFLFSNIILSNALILPVSQLQIQASDDVTNQVIFNTDLLYSCAHFIYLFIYLFIYYTIALMHTCACIRLLDYRTFPP